MINTASFARPKNSQQNRTRNTAARQVALHFKPDQSVPEVFLQAIVQEWLVPALVEDFLRNHGVATIKGAALGGK
jgi:hypothetical protein